MKITPIAASGAGKTTISDEGRSAGASRVAKAKAVLAGGPAAIAPEVAAQAPAPRTEEPSIKKIRMRTKATPLQAPAEAPADVASTEAAATESNVSDETEQATAAEATNQLSPQLAALAKKERALQVKEREIAERERVLSAKESGAGTQAQTDSIPTSRIKSDFLSVLEEQGIDYDHITEAVLARSHQQGPGYKQLQDEIKALKEGLEQSQAQRDQAAETQALTQIGRDLDRLLEQSGETYDVIRATGSKDKVLDLIKRTFKESGEILDLTEASDLIEAELFEDQLKVAQLKKIQSKLSQPAQPKAPAANTQNQPIRTLTSRDSTSAPLSRKERALLAFHGKLPQ